MKIRPSAASDAEAIDVLFQGFVAYLRSIGDRGEYRFGAEQYLADGCGPDPAFRGLVAEAEEGLVGYLLFSRTYDGDYTRGFYIVDLCVREDFRGRGVGRLLMEEIQRLAREEGIARVSWHVHRNNERAIRFYEKLGAKYLTEAHTMSLNIV